MLETVRRLGLLQIDTVSTVAPPQHFSTRGSGPSMTALRLYTDGSCAAPGTVGGWAWILVSEHTVASGSGATPGSSTHNAAELTAAIEGLAYLIASVLSR